MVASDVRNGARRAPGARLAAAVVLAALAAQCGGTSASTAPSPSVTLTGTFSGSATDTSGPGTMTLTLSQSGASVSGSATLADSTTGVSGRGTVSGTLSGASLSFTITIPAGGFPAPYGACTAQSQGTAQATDTSIQGTYSGQNSCTGPFQNGHFTLTKQ